jgi:hypothetical protein
MLIRFEQRPFATPQANGGAERVIRNINWDLFLPHGDLVLQQQQLQFEHWCMTPFEAHFCRPSVQVQDVILNNPLPSCTNPKLY